MADSMMWSVLLPTVAVLLALLVMPGSAYLLLLSLAGWRKAALPDDRRPAVGHIAIVVPAHDEAEGIGRTVDNLVAIARQDGEAVVCVIADNCSDATAEVARAHGARVLERHDPELRGKGYALNFAFGTLAEEGFLAYVVIDADTLAEANLLQILRGHFGQGARAVQSRYTVLNADDSPRTRLSELALCAFNCLRPRGRHVLGWSAGILGNGFALHRSVLERVPYTATSVVEDLEYHLRLIDAGIRVHFADETIVRGDMPVAADGQKTQRARWEGGRIRMLIEHGPSLLRRVMLGQWRFCEPLLDLMLLPLAYHAVLLLLLLALPWLPAKIIGLAGLAIVLLHVLIAAWVGGIAFSRLLATFLSVPRYVAWKLTMLRSTTRAAKASTHWVRTQRDRHS